MGKHMLIIGLVWPEPSSSAAGWRMMQLISLFLSKGYRLTFASAASKSPYSFPLSSQGVMEQEIELNSSSFDSWVAEIQPDLVLFDRFMIEEQYSWRVAQACPNAIRILDTEDLHFIRQARQEAFKKGIADAKELYYSDVAKRELASIYRSDISLIISEFEMQVLQEEFQINNSLLQYLPFQISDQEASQEIPFEERFHFMFIGNFLHEPNWKTVQVLKELWPSIRKRLPKAELHIYGAYPSEKVFQLHQEKQGFIIKGRAENAIETMKQYRVLLAPIPFGAGQKGKFIDALHAGTPSVTSTIGAEGMFQGLEWPGFIASTQDELIEQAIQLHEDPSSWNLANQKAAQTKLSIRDLTWGLDLLQRIEDVQDQLEQHRLRNMVGQILWSTQHLSTKYLSQWIEEKNKKAHP